MLTRLPCTKCVHTAAKGNDFKTGELEEDIGWLAERFSGPVTAVALLSSPELASLRPSSAARDPVRGSFWRGSPVQTSQAKVPFLPVPRGRVGGWLGACRTALGWSCRCWGPPRGSLCTYTNPDHACQHLNPGLFLGGGGGKQHGARTEQRGGAQLGQSLRDDRPLLPGRSTFVSRSK